MISLFQDFQSPSFKIIILILDFGFVCRRKAFEIPGPIFREVMETITRAVEGVNRVVYDITSNPRDN